VDVISLFMALLSSRGIDTQSLQARGEQRRSIYFNNDRDIPRQTRQWLMAGAASCIVVYHNCATSAASLRLRGPRQYRPQGHDVRSRPRLAS
jgi:hypothetical protein